CHALPGERCQVVGTSQELTKVPAHPSRLVATGKGAA
ncbi:MAG: zinc finger domain-containing protein, partial [Acidimicrobiia bacterium]